jgi:hypothetical protein
MAWETMPSVFVSPMGYQMSEECSKDCTVHGRLDERLIRAESDIKVLFAQNDERNKGNWQLVTAIGLSFLSIVMNLLMAWIKGS